MLTAWTKTYNDYEAIFLLLFATKFLWIINIKQLELKIRMIRFLRIKMFKVPTHNYFTVCVI